jgi:CubicO group peptidase (beta-lactamase class C family)
MAGAATPGMAALIMRDFRVTGELTAGVRALGSSAPVQRGDRWHLGSDGKAMTATLCARLVERGALAWDDTLDRRLPQLAETMHPSYRDVTLANLLTHRSGLPENITNLDLFGQFYESPAPLPEQRLHYIDLCLREAPAAEKRAAYSYSNTGYLIAGALAERAAGEAFEPLITREVFAPLRMRSVSFNNYGGAGEPMGHVDGRIANQPRDANPAMFAPAGGMRMSLSDWARFCIAHMRGEKGASQLLSAETFRYLHTAQDGGHAALGWGSVPQSLGRRGPALTHSGSDGNWNALVVLYPSSGDGVLVVANAAESMGGDAACSAAIHAIATDLSEPVT